MRHRLRLFSLILIVVFIFSFTACTAPKTATETTTPAIQETTPPTTVVETTTPETIKEVDAPEIAGLTFNQEAKSYFNEAGVEVGIYIEEAVKINDEMRPAIGLKPETIRNILNENKEKGIFKCPWPFDFQKIRELK